MWGPRGPQEALRAQARCRRGSWALNRPRWASRALAGFLHPDQPETASGDIPPHALSPQTEEGLGAGKGCPPGSQHLESWLFQNPISAWVGPDRAALEVQN